MFYLDNEYCGISKLLEQNKVKNAELSSGKVILELENGSRVVIEYEEYEGLNITASTIS